MKTSQQIPAVTWIASPLMEVTEKSLKREKFKPSSLGHWEETGLYISW